MNQVHMVLNGYKEYKFMQKRLSHAMTPPPPPPEILSGGDDPPQHSQKLASMYLWMILVCFNI